MKAVTFKRNVAIGAIILLVGAFGGARIALGDTVYVDHEGLCDGNTPCYTTIGVGINAASNGDTVYVYGGTYYEHVVISKPIHLVGENDETTIIDGGGSDDVVRVSSDSVFIREFTITNSGTTSVEGYWDSGIELDYSDYSEVMDCIFTLNEAGLCLYGSSYNTIYDCRFHSNTAGIVFSEAYPGPYQDNFGNRILSNTIDHNSNQGIYFEHTFATYHHSSVLKSNSISYNGVGISMIMSQENEICCNTISGNTGYGISLEMDIGGGQYNKFHHNNFISNNDGGVQASAYSEGVATNYWYSEILEQGNYWSDYTGPDMNGDGIGDAPYDIDGGESQDLHPLMALFMCGDPNGDGISGIADVIYLINYLFRSGPVPEFLSTGDANFDGVVDSADVLHLVNYLFVGGPWPGC